MGNYWNQTETFEALQLYIDMNFEGLRDDILSMLAGEEVPVNTGSFTNDMATFRTEDDVLTLLIHLGYLGYRYATRQYLFQWTNSVAAICECQFSIRLGRSIQCP